MRKKLTTYIEEKDIKLLKRIALEQETSVADILGALVTNHLNRRVYCICDLDKHIDTKLVQYEANIFEYDRFEDLEYAIRFYKDDKEVCFIEHEFLEVTKKGNITELTPCEDFIIDFDNNFFIRVN